MNWLDHMNGGLVSGCALLAVVACVVVGSCQRSAVSAANVDSRAVLPSRELKKDEYRRYYLLTTIRTADDVPFTTMGPMDELEQLRPVWVAVFARDHGRASAPPGLRVVADRRELPEFFHGGCRTVNLVADARSGETLASWCNVDFGPPVDGMPPPVPVYTARDSPFH